MAKQNGIVEPMRIKEVQRKCPDEYAKYINSAFPS
jgi:hypothetical protein